MERSCSTRSSRPALGDRAQDAVSYGLRRVLHEVSLTVENGEVLALIGPNGAGKSTLVRAGSGVVPAQGGSASKNGTNLLTAPASDRARTISVVPQVASLPPAFTVWETVLLGRRPYLNFLGQVSAAVAEEFEALLHVERDRVIDFASDAGFHHYLACWLALLRADLPAAMEHLVHSEKLSAGLGLWFVDASLLQARAQILMHNGQLRKRG